MFQRANAYRRRDRSGGRRRGANRTTGRRSWRRGGGGGARGRSTVSNSRGLEKVARFGFIARGIAYIVLGILGFMLAVGTAEHSANEVGALAALSEQPLGYLLLWILVFGFAALAVWRFTQVATAGRTVSGGHRAYAAVAGVFYALAFFFTLRFVVNGRLPVPGEVVARDFTIRILAWPGGQVVVALLGIAVLAFGLLLIVRGARLHFTDDLRMGWMTRGSRTAAVWLGRAGYIARGAVVAAIGLAALVAALNYDPAQVEGVDGVLRDFAGTPFGPWLLILIALGLIAFGLLSFLEARHRRTYGGVPV